MNVPFVDLKMQYSVIKDEVVKELSAICENTSFVLGPAVSKFEKNYSGYIGVKHAVGVNSGTSAVQLALQSLIQPGDEVITVPNTFIATTEAITAAGGVIKFVDIDEFTFNMDPNKLHDAVTSKTRAIIPVHLYGQPADMDPVMEVARHFDLYVIEDAAQAHGALYKGQKTGSIGHAAAFSFYPGKNLGAYGEAGAVTTDSDKIAEFVRMYRDHGSKEKYIHDFEGNNMRMEAFQGAVLVIKLKYLNNWNNLRRRKAEIYQTHFKDMEGIVSPREKEYARHIFHLYVIRVKKREELQKYLTENGIGCGYHYKIPLHLQKAYRHLGYKKGDFPVTEKVMKQIISLPMFPELSEKQIEYVAGKVREFVGR